MHIKNNRRFHDQFEQYFHLPVKICKFKIKYGTLFVILLIF
jgi:hypothetical protein